MTELNKQWCIARHPVGKPQAQDFVMRETPIPAPHKGEVLLKTLYLGLAPVMRMYMQGKVAANEKPLAIGDVIHGRGVAEVVESHHPDYKAGDIVQGQMGWQTYKVSKMTAQEKFFHCPDLGINYAHFIASVGMTGLSAWAGYTDCGAPQKGDVVLVSGAAGGVGSLVVQIARLLGAGKVIGIAGSETKCAWLKTLGVNETINYNEDDIEACLTKFCPDGIDIYFDNVGGAILEAALNHLAYGARIVLCGSISEYTKAEKWGPPNYTALRSVNGTMKGFFVYNYLARFTESMQQLGGWLKSGELVSQLDIVDGLDKMPQALMRLYESENIGKQCCRVVRGKYDMDA